tara:strand:- start:229 stop:1170 length:942 start_codon:yes stop_codon:yes gene_type:complete
MKIKKIFITGVAGFIGSNFASYILKNFKNSTIIGIDNLKVGKLKYIKEILNEKKFTFIKCDLKNKSKIFKISKGCDLVIHLASNADIAKAVKNPLIDYYEGFNLTLNVLEAMRKNNIKNIIFSSGSGVYDESYDKPLIENYSDLKPISTYGANKLSSESFISAYSHLYNIKSLIFRFANVVGKNQTHGVAFDFYNNLRKNPKKIKIMGNGRQKKSYIDVSDVINASFLALKKTKKNFEIYNISNDDRITVKQILNLVINNLKLKRPKIILGKTNRGWTGDVPFVKLSNKKLKKLGWKFKFSSQNAILNSLKYF